MCKCIFFRGSVGVIRRRGNTLVSVPKHSHGDRSFYFFYFFFSAFPQTHTYTVVCFLFCVFDRSPTEDCHPLPQFYMRSTRAFIKRVARRVVTSFTPIETWLKLKRQHGRGEHVEMVILMQIFMPRQSECFLLG